MTRLRLRDLSAELRALCGVSAKPRRRKPPPAREVGQTAAHAQLVAWCAASGLPVPVAEFKFHPGRGWRFDFAWPGQIVALEIDGAVYAQGRHTRGRGYERDREKLNEAVCLGWRVVVVSTGQFASGSAFGWLGRLLKGSA